MRGEAGHWLSLFEPVVGGDGVASSDSVCAQYAIHDQRPRCVVWPRSDEQVVAILQACAREGLAAVPWGAGARQGQLPAPRRYDVALCLRKLDALLSHEAEDLTVTVQAGATVAEVEKRLASHGQWLALEPACPDRTTVGGLVAAAADGLCRARFGRVRDSLLGIRFVTGDGTVVQAGGRVVKNVAGYDLMKLLTGSWGTLGVVLQATFKVWPRPKAQSLWLLPAESWEQAAAVGDELEQSSLEPALLAIQAFSDTGGRPPSAMPCVLVGFLGVAEDVSVREQAMQAVVASSTWTRLPPERVPATWNAVRDFPLLACAGETVGFRCSVLPAEVKNILLSVGAETIRRGGLLAAWPQSGTLFLRLPARNRTEIVAWHEVLWAEVVGRGGQVWVDRWHPLLDGVEEFVRLRGAVPRLIQLMRGVRATLDLAATLSPGRMGTF